MRGMPPTLTRPRKAAYSAVNFAIGATEYVTVIFLLKFYTDFTGLDPKLAGAALVVGKLFDAVSDPAMGWISDHTPRRFGRRRPWFLAGALPMAAATAGMFAADPAWSQGALFAWLTAMNVLYFAGSTVIEVPHAALASELTRSHTERVSIMAWRQGFMTAGFLAGGVAMFLALEAVADRVRAAARAEPAAVAEMVRVAKGAAHGDIMAVFAAVLVVLAVVSYLGSFEPARGGAPPRETVFGDLGDALRSAPFRLYTFSYTIGQVADVLTASLALYAIEQWWGLGDPHPRLLMIGHLLVALATIPLWLRIADRFDKHHLLIAGVVVGAGALALMPLVPVLGTWWAYVTLYVAGAGLGVRMVMSLAIVPDIVDEDELRTRTRKDGAYFGMYSLLRKLARAGALGLGGLGLAAFGYESGAAEQSPEAIRGIAILFCGAPMVSIALAGLIIWRYPIGRARHAEILRALDARRAGAPEIAS